MFLIKNKKKVFKRKWFILIRFTEAWQLANALILVNTVVYVDMMHNRFILQQDMLICAQICFFLHRTCWALYFQYKGCVYNTALERSCKDLIGQSEYFNITVSFSTTMLQFVDVDLEKPEHKKQEAA